MGEYPYRLNGHISTQHQVDFLYGVAAARMKFQRDPGAHAAFWLQPRGLLDTGPTPWGAEIDVVEWYGNNSGRSRLSSTVHAPLPSGEKVSFGGPVSKPDRFLSPGRTPGGSATTCSPWSGPRPSTSSGSAATKSGAPTRASPTTRSSSSSACSPATSSCPRLANVEGLTQTASVDWVKVWQADPLAGS